VILYSSYMHFIYYLKDRVCDDYRSNIYIIMWMLAILAALLTIGNMTVLTLSGGELTINGAVTSTYIDLFMNFTANV